MTTSRPRRVAVALAATLLLTACAGDPAQEETPATPPPAEPESTPSPEPMPSAEPTEEPTEESTGPCDRDARTFEVVATNFSFDVERLAEVCTGDSVTLTVEEGGHSFTAPAEATGDTGVFNDGSRTTVVSAPGSGTYEYRCTLHPQMRVEVVFIG